MLFDEQNKDNSINSIKKYKTAKQKKRVSQTQGRMPSNIKLENCRYCGKKITEKRRRTFCSEECVHEHLIRTNVKYMKEQVYKRDRGICSICGIDCHHQPKDYNTLKDLFFSEYRIRNYIQKNHTLWDADHIHPVSNGGGGCSLENLRTLCERCHRKVTNGIDPSRLYSIWDFCKEEPSGENF